MERGRPEEPTERSVLNFFFFVKMKVLLGLNYTLDFTEKTEGKNDGGFSLLLFQFEASESAHLCLS